MTAAGFPHSGITGSTPTCGSPMLFAAYHALLRLSVPRHPPCALIRLTGYAHARLPRPVGRVRQVGIPVHLADTRVAPSSLQLSLDAYTQPITQVFKLTTRVQECFQNARPVSAFDRRSDLLAAPERR